MKDEQKIVTWLRMLANTVREECGEGKTADGIDGLVAYATLAIRLWQMMPGSQVGDVKIEKIILKPDLKVPGRVMLICTGVQKKQKVVTFHSGTPDADLFHTFIARGREGRLKWKLDTPWEPGAENGQEESLPGLGGP